MYYSPSSVQYFIDLFSPMGYSRNLITKFYEHHRGSNDLEDNILNSLLEYKNQGDQGSLYSSVKPKMSSCLKRLKTSTYSDRSKQDSERPQKFEREDLNPEKILRHSPKDHVGFQNEQNLCTLNSILQILLPVKPFLEAILKFRMPKISRLQKNKKINASFILISKLQELFADVLYGNRLELNTSDIASNIPYNNGVLSKMFMFLTSLSGELLKPGDQADVEEIFTLLKEAIEDGLISSCLEDTSVYKTLPPEISDFKNLLNGSSQDCTEIIFQNGKTNEKPTQSSEFGVINLNVTQRGFFPVLRAALTSIIDDYKDKTGNLATVKKRTWILEPPKLLTFRPQRAFFDSNGGEVVRSDEEFDFPLEFYLDEFLAKNRKKIEGTLQEIEDSVIANQQQLQTLQDSRNNLIHTYNNFEKEIQLINQPQKPNKDLKSIKEDMNSLQTIIKNIDTRMTNIHKHLNNLHADSRKILSEMKEVKYKLQGVVMHEGSADLGHYYALTFNHNTKVWTKFNDTKIRELSHEEGYNFARGIVIQTEPKGKYAIESKPCAYMIFYARENCEVLDWSRKTLEELKTISSPDLIQNVDICNQKFLMECRDFKERPFLMTRVYSEFLKKINELPVLKHMDPIPDLENFKDLLLLDKTKCSELLNYITLREIIDSVDVHYKILEGETENYYFKELEKLMTAKNSESPLKSLHLSLQNQNLLREKQEEFKRLKRCRVISEKILQCALESNFPAALITTVYLYQSLQTLEKTGYNVQFFEFANWIFRVLTLKATLIIAAGISLDPNKNDYKTQARSIPDCSQICQTRELLEILTDCVNKREITKLRQTFSSEIKNILKQALNANWSNYGRKDSIINQMSFYIENIGSKKTFFSENQVESFIPQVPTKICVIHNSPKDLIQNLIRDEADSLTSQKPKLLQLYESFKENFKDIVEMEKDLSLSEIQYKSPQFHQKRIQPSFSRSAQENLPPANHQAPYSNSFSSQSKIINEFPGHFVNMKRN